MTMTSRRPYMIRAFYEWIVDNNCTPYLLVNARANGVEVPQEHVNKDGQIILNIAPASVVDLDMLDDSISFSARFGGVPRRLFIPSFAVQGIYARENGQGMVFEAEAEPPQPLPPSGGDDNESKRPSLRVVK